MYVTIGDAGTVRIDTIAVVIAMTETAETEVVVGIETTEVAEMTEIVEADVMTEIEEADVMTETEEADVMTEIEVAGTIVAAVDQYFLFSC